MFGILTLHFNNFIEPIGCTSGTISLVEIEFQPVGKTVDSPLTFQSDFPRNTDVTYGGASIRASDLDGKVIISTGYQVFLPSVIR
jgi:hypothetical protein